MARNFLGLTAGWIKKVERDGSPAIAIILSDPQEVTQRVGNYEGPDAWVDIRARVEAPGTTPFEGALKARLSQVAVVRPGLRVNVKYDLKDPRRAVLVDDIPTILRNRAVK
jgi:hypothetical protein